MKLTKILCIILCFAMLIPALVGCNQTGGDDQVTTEAPEANVPDTPDEPQYKIENEFVSFIAYNKETAGVKKMTEGSSFGGRFTVTEGYLEQMNILMGPIGDIEFKLYKWNKDYNTSIAGEPIFEKNFKASEMDVWYVAANSCNIEIKFDEDEIGTGHYLYVVSVPEDAETIPSLYTGSAWSSKLPEKYSYYSQYNLISYANGEKTTAGALQTSYVMAKKVTVTEEAEQPLPDGQDAEGTAKVIILGGQSNAVGVALCDMLKDKVSAEKYEQYTNGFSNVQIMYENVTHPNCNNEFGPVKLGQGAETKYFGPELGIADFLAEHYPNEKFYIIKYAKGGSVLETDWMDAKTGEPLNLLVGLTYFVQDGLAKLEAEGLTPKIVGFVWNQGESDSIFIPRASRYTENLTALVNYVRTTFEPYAAAKGIGFVDATIRGSVWAAYRFTNLQKMAFAETSPINFCIDVTKYDEIDTLEENGDLAHYDSLGMLMLGQLYGEAIGKLLG